MKITSILFIILFLGSCSYKNIGEYGPNTSIIDYNELPIEVQDAYKVEFNAVSKRSVHTPVVIINLDSTTVNFISLESTTIAIIKPGKDIYKIGHKKYHIPWNLNRELKPKILFDKHIYMVYAVTGNEKLTYYNPQNLKTNRYLKVDLSKHLKY